VLTIGFCMFVYVACFGCVNNNEQAAHGGDARVIAEVEDYLGIKLGMTYKDLEPRAKCYFDGSLRGKWSVSETVSFYRCEIVKDGDVFIVLLDSKGDTIRSKDKVLGVITSSKKFKLKDGVGVGTSFRVFKSVYGGLSSDGFKFQASRESFIYLKETPIVLRFTGKRRNYGLMYTADFLDDSEEVMQLYFFKDKNIYLG